MAILILDATTKSIVVAMSGAAATTNPDFTAAWADNDGSTFTEGATDGALNGTNSVTLVAAPASSTRRTIKTITIENKDTAAVTLTISYNNNSTLRTIAKVTLQVGDTWTTDGTFDTNGNLKTVIGSVNLATQVTGTLPVANGGTGATTLTGVLKGNGTSAFTAASAGTDYVAPGTATTFTALQTFGAGLTVSSGTLSDPAGNVRDIPSAGSEKTTAYTLTISDIGEFVTVGTSGSITVVNDVFSAGNAVSIYNNTSGNVTLTMSITTAYIAGTDADKATMTLATRGVATMLFLSSSAVVVTGNVS
jgi:hypothetical protein